MSRKAVLGRVALWACLAAGLMIMWAQYGASAASTLLTIISGCAALTGIVAAGRLRWGRTSASEAEQLTIAAQTLAREVRAQWESEAGRRLLENDGQLAIRWQGYQSGSNGELRDLITTYADQPRRLVVVGDPGSGKTGLCVLVALELLRRPEPPQVPVILQVSAWAPEENLHTWIMRSILENYPFLANETKYGPTAVRDLLVQHRILPVLDGLDEMATDSHTQALHALVMDTRSDEPLVVTCRTHEFDAANAAGTVRDAQVVQLLPIDAEAAAGYLLDAVSDVRIERWDPVLAQLTENGYGPVAAALRTPLMLFLCRMAYAHPQSDPAELLALPDARHVEEHLLDAFIPCVFTTRPPSALSDSPAPGQLWDPGQAESWLAFLARHSGRDIAWWRLNQLVPRAVGIYRGALVGAACCTPFGWLLFALFNRPALGALIGLGIGVTSSVGLSLVPPESPRRFVPRLLRRREWYRDLAFGVIGALVGGLAVGILVGAGHGIAIGLVFGLAFAMVRRFTEPTEPDEEISPLGMLRSDRRTVFYAAGLGGIVGALVGATLGGLVDAIGRELVLPIENPVLLSLLGAAVGGLIGSCGLGLVVQATGAWGRFVTARWWLTYRRGLPRRLMSFLEDAHRLGVLRQAGPYYQFRHALLHDRLARRPSVRPAPRRAPKSSRGRTVAGSSSHPENEPERGFRDASTDAS